MRSIVKASGIGTPRSIAPFAMTKSPTLKQHRLNFTDNKKNRWPVSSLIQNFYRPSFQKDKVLQKELGVLDAFAIGSTAVAIPLAVTDPICTLPAAALVNSSLTFCRSFALLKYLYNKQKDATVAQNITSGTELR